MRTRLIASIFASMALLAGCGDAPSGGGETVTRAATDGFRIGDMPDPATWSDKKLWYYFHNQFGVPKWKEDRGPHYKDHTIKGRVVAKCGRVAPHADIGKSTRAKIRFTQKARAETPERARCWAETGPQLVERRIEELAYLKALAPRIASIPTPKARRGYKGNIGWVDNTSIDRELDDFEGAMRSFALADKRLAQMSALYGGWQSKRRASNMQALTSALESFSNDNPLTRPGPGQRQVPGMLMADLIPGASPELKVALANLDRTMFGEDAYAREIHRRAAAMGAAQIAAANREAGYGTGSMLTMTMSCAYGRGEDGKCIDPAKVRAAQRARMERERAENKAANAAALARRMAEARAAAAERAANTPVCPSYPKNTCVVAH